jgi:hypothetical protein
MKIMAPSPTERDERFKSFARAQFMDAPYGIVTPDFLWRFHDGLRHHQIARISRFDCRAPRRTKGAVLGAAFSRCRLIIIPVI